MSLLIFMLMGVIAGWCIAHGLEARMKHRPSRVVWAYLGPGLLWVVLVLARIVYLMTKL